MCYSIGKVVTLNNHDKYKFTNKHRVGGNPHASIWTISFSDELSLMNNCIANNYFQNNYLTAYNVMPGLRVLGRNSINNDLKISKFVNSTPGLWHGYPADHVKNNQDRPQLEVLKKMADNNAITIRQMNKIGRGKRI